MSILTATVIAKGGVGKTTLSLMQAHDLVRRGYKTLVIDCDPQGNAGDGLAGVPHAQPGCTRLFEAGRQPDPIHTETEGLYLIPSDGLPLSVPKTRATLRLFRSNVMSAAEKIGADFVVFDTPPSVSFLHHAILSICHYCWSPMRPSVWSIRGIEQLLGQMLDAQETGNPNLHFIGVVLNQVSRRNTRDQEAEAALREGENGDLILTPTIGARACLSSLEFEGVPVWKLPRTGAARTAVAEVRAVMDILFSSMEGSL